MELIRYDIVQFAKCLQTFRRNQLPVSAGNCRWM